MIKIIKEGKKEFTATCPIAAVGFLMSMKICNWHSPIKWFNVHAAVKR